MSWKGKSNGSGNFELAPEGDHTAILIQIIDLGLQEKTWEGQTSLKPTVRLGFELPDEKMEDGRPFTVYKTVTKSLHPKGGLADVIAKALRLNDKESLTDEDVSKALGKAIQITVTHGKDGRFANIVEISRLNPKIPVGDRHNELLIYDTEASDHEIFGKLTEKTQQKIREGVSRKSDSSGHTGDLGEEQHQEPPQF